MKKSNLIALVCASITISLLTACNNTTEDLHDAKKELVEVENKIEEANEEYLKDMEEYKKEIATTTAANKKIISDFNARIASKKSDAKEDYEQKIADLDKKNTDMQKKMDEYKSNGKESWENFKTEFARDMDELGKSFKDLTVKNVD